MRLTLRPKFLLAFLGLSLGPLVLSGYLSIRATHLSLVENTRLILDAAARQHALRIDAFIRDNLNLVRTQSLLPSIQDYMALEATRRSGSSDEVEALRTLDAFRRKDHVNLASYALVDAEGRCLLNTADASLFDPEERAFLLRTLQAGLPLVSGLLPASPQGREAIGFAAPVRNARGETVGLIRARYNLAAIQKLVFEMQGLLGPGSQALLVDERRVKLADSFGPEGLMRPVEAPWAKGLQSGAHFTANLRDAKDTSMMAAVVAIESQPWNLVVAMPRSAFWAAYARQVLNTGALLVAIGVLAVCAALATAGNLARPILGLAAIARQIARGNLGSRADAERTDELGQLGESFNGMAEALQASREELLTHAQRLETLLDTIPDVAMVHRPDGSIVSVNRAAETIYGYARGAYQDLNVADFSGSGYTQEMARARVEAATRKGSLDFEWMGRNKDGVDFPIFVRLRRMQMGKEPYILAVVTDMTERKRLEAQLFQAQKMQAIGTLAGGIAHDFNNLLASIRGYTSILLLDLAPDDPAGTFLRKIEEQVESGAGLAKQLLGFARGGKFEVRPLALNPLVERTADTFGRTRKDVLIHLRLEMGLWAVEGDEGQLEQVLVNLFVNACQAMPNGGDLFLETGNLELDSGKAGKRGIAPGRWIYLLVADTGVGMDEKTRVRIFEPFFTTKERGRGTGLGLASVYGILQNHGGAIEVTSAPELGTTFSLLLPASSVMPPAPAPNVDPAPVKGTGTLLLVDDEASIRESGSKALERLGYRVFTAESGAAAVAFVQAHPGMIDLVILDMIMPGMGGKETFLALRALEPGLRALLSSGYALDGAASEIMALGCSGFIQKPYALRDLSRVVRDLLERS